MISVIIPFHNEKDNLPILLEELIRQLGKLNDDFELIFVDDGSDDYSVDKLKEKISFFGLQSQNYKIISHRKKLGKGAALKSGIDHAKGEIIVFIDSDLQDDPKDLPLFLKKIEEGFDFVNGLRIKRQDSTLIKVYSRLASFFLRKVLKSPYSDINCGFKVFKRDVLKNFVFYGNNFRFFPLWVYHQGFRVTEVEVRNNPRKFGRSKFGKSKVFVGIIDLLTAYFLFKFSEKPLHFFGIIGGLLLLFGSIILLYLLIERLFFNILLYRRPILFLGILLVIVGIQIVMTGIIAELMVFLNKKKES